MKDEYFNFKETPITFILVAVNIIVFIVLEIMGDTTDGEFMLESGAMNPGRILEYGEFYRLFSATFLHFGIEHLMNNMLLLFFLGQFLEREVGPTRYLGIYLISGLSGSFLSFLYMAVMGRNDIVAGASGGIFGLVGGLLIVVIVNRGHFRGISIKRMLFMVALTLYFGFAQAGVDNVGHLGGIITGFSLTYLSYGISTLIRMQYVDFEDEKNYTLDNNDDNEGR